MTSLGSLQKTEIKHSKPPEQTILNQDATDDPLHGNQEGRLFTATMDWLPDQWTLHQPVWQNRLASEKVWLVNRSRFIRAA